MRLTPSQLEVIRKRPQSSTLYLSIFQPQIVFKAQVNYPAMPTKGERDIPYTLLSGSYLSVVPNATLWIGTSDGAQDRGKLRIKSITATVITVSENDNIEWQDGLYLTAFYYVELWPVYPRIVQVVPNSENVTFYKDWDTAYTNQNSILGTFPNAGAHRGLFRGEQAYYSATGSYNALGDALTYSWAFEGGSPTGSTLETPGNVTYNTPGDYVTRLTISNASGGSDTTYRYVAVRDREGQGNYPPIDKWELLNYNGSRDEGGYSADFRVHQDVALQENSVVCIFTEDDYNGSAMPFDDRIFFVGYVTADSIHYDYAHSYVEFSAVSLTGLMKSSLGFSVSVESVVNPTKWFELKNMDCRRAIYHYLKWHTTALNIGDFQFLGTDQNIQFFDADRSSMYDAIDNLMRDTLIGKAVSDRKGKVWLEVDASAYPNPTGTYTSVMDITNRDWINEPDIEEQMSDSISYLELGGIAYTGPAIGTFSAILSAAPGNTPSFRGEIDTHEGLSVADQNQLNIMAGNVLANRNAPYPRVNMNLGINARNLDIAPQETTNLSILASDTVRNLAIQGLYLPNGMDWKYNSKNLILLPNVEFKVLLNGPAGATIDVASNDVGGGFEVPPVQIPPIPDLTIPAPFVPTGTISAIVTTMIQQYQTVYARRSDLVSESRGGVTIDAISITDTLSTIQMTVPTAGVYFVAAYFEQNSTGGTTGQRDFVNFQINLPGPGIGLQSNFVGLANNGGNAKTTGELAGCLFIESMETVVFILTSFGGAGGTLAAPSSYSLSVARLSA